MQKLDFLGTILGPLYQIYININRDPVAEEVPEPLNSSNDPVVSEIFCKKHGLAGIPAAKCRIKENKESCSSFQVEIASGGIYF